MGGLRVSGLQKSFGEILAVSSLHLEVPRGALVGFLGANGAGKTTTMRSVMGMVRPDSGSLTWDEAVIDETSRKRFGYMPQERGLYARMKVREQIVYFGRLAGLTPATAKSAADSWLERLGLSDRADDLVQELSGGNQQRVQLAVSLVHEPELLVLDEPFAGLDPIAAETMRSIISDKADEGAAVLFSSHQLDLVEDLCEQVVIIANGAEVASGAISDLRAASPTRLLSVQWNDSVDDWQPLAGDMTRPDNHSADVVLDANDDLDAHVAHALAAGSVASLRLEPPSLDAVFADVLANPEPSALTDGAAS